MRQAERVARSAYPPSQTEVTPVLTARDRFALKYGWHYAADSRAVPRPQQVASLALRGASVNETAVLLGIQEATVKTYLYATVAKPRGLKPTGKVAHRIFLKYLAILPAEIAKEQAAFELDTMIARAVEQGAKLKECAQVLGVSALRVSQRRDKGNRRRKGPSTPIGRYFAEVSELVCMRPESQSPVPSWQNAMFGAWAGMGL
jgi:predicted transcriptional regulator